MTNYEAFMIVTECLKFGALVSIAIVLSVKLSDIVTKLNEIAKR